MHGLYRAISEFAVGTFIEGIRQAFSPRGLDLSGAAMELGSLRGELRKHVTSAELFPDIDSLPERAREWVSQCDCSGSQVNMGISTLLSGCVTYPPAGPRCTRTSSAGTSKAPGAAIH